MTRKERLAKETIGRESERRLAWLKHIASSCRGKAPALVRQALYSTVFPPEGRTRRTHKP